jgi:L-lactate dehydrogenase
MKIGVVGTGLVGSTAAYALVMRGVGREIVLVDKNMDRARAEADDISHAVPFEHPLEVRAGDYSELAGARVVILAAGVGQRPGETRPELLARNAEVFAAVVPQVVRHARQAVLVVATNPVDVMTHLAAHYAAKAGGTPGRVLGSGTTLDTARFRSLLGRHCGVDPHHVHAYVIGEHGDSEVLTWSLATVGGTPFETFSAAQGRPVSDEIRRQIDRQVRGAAYSIISGKGATYYGIGSALARIADVILHDQRAILTVCSRMDDVQNVKDVTLALPRLVGGDGVLDTLPVPLDDAEQTQLRTSAETIRSAIDSLSL